MSPSRPSASVEHAASPAGPVGAPIPAVLTQDPSPGPLAEHPVARDETTTRWAFHPQWLLVTAAVLFNYWFLRAETTTVSYLNDSSIHEQMVRFATSRIEAGHLPQTSWFPYLGLGSPQFLHYQGLPATITGLAGTVLGPNRAFTWSLYLLLSLWPVSVYAGARAFRFGRWTAALAALCSPFLMSKTGVGFEIIGYVWIGYGLWAQLWAMFTLPLAWGFSWQAITEGRRYFWAVLFVSLTVMFHFETGYLALIPLGLFPFVGRTGLGRRVRRAVGTATASLAVTAWVTVPLITMGNWASVNEILRGTPLENGYGARQVLAWLVSGHLLDAGRLPVVTVLAGIGLVVTVVRARRDLLSRALLMLLAMSLLLSFGRTTFGSLVDIIPGSTDIFMRRFMMGVQLSCLLLAGVGGVATASFVLRRITRWRPVLDHGPSSARMRGGIAVTGAVVLAVVFLSPAWTQVAARDRVNAQAISFQQRADAGAGARIAPLLRRVARAGDGRVYAGLPNNWGANFTVGEVPVLKYLESQDIDEVGYTIRTASLMTDPEFFFDQSNPGDYSAFGVRYLILPDGDRPPVPARLVMMRSPYALWKVPSVGYVSVAQVVGTMRADRTNIGLRSVGFLRSPLPRRSQTLAVAFAGGSPGVSISTRPATTPPGVVLHAAAHLAQGETTADVAMRRPGVVVLSASFDPGWHATVDGRPARTVMVAPALVAVEVGPGTHHVTFTYGGYGSYAPLFVLGALVLIALAAYDVIRRRREPN